MPDPTTPPAPTPDVKDGPVTPAEPPAPADPNDGLPEVGAPSAAQASDALDRMLSKEPPALPTARFNMGELAKRLEADLPAEQQTEDPEFWIKVRALGEEEFEAIQRRCRRAANKEEREAGVTGAIVDQKRSKRLIIAVAMVEPNLQDPRLLQRDGPHPEHVIQRWFLPGEIEQLSEAILDLSGWSEGALDRAKK